MLNIIKNFSLNNQISLFLNTMQEHSASYLQTNLSNFYQFTSNIKKYYANNIQNEVLVSKFLQKLNLDINTFPKIEEVKEMQHMNFIEQDLK